MWPGRTVKTGLTIALVVLGLALVDRRVATIGGKDPYAEELERPFVRLARAKRARHVVVGSSTSEWLPPAIQRAWKLPRGAVADAHVRDCHPTCTLSEVRRLVELGYHFQTAFFGVNPFTYCEAYRARRSMQDARLMPLGGLPALFGVYLQSSEPFRYLGGFVLNSLSQTYGTTMRLQRHHRKAAFGNETLHRDWYRSGPPPKKRKSNPFRCDYSTTRRSFGLAATRAATRALSELADEVVVVLLPDRGLVGDDQAASRALFVREHEELVRGIDRARVENLVTPKLTQKSRFRDGAHLARRGIQIGTRLIAERLARHPRPESDAAPPPRP